MSARTDRVNLIVTINGDKAKKKLGELENEAAAVRTRMKELSKATKGYEAAAKKLKNPNLGAKAMANAKLKMEALQASHDEYQKNAKRLEVVKTEIQSLHEEIGSAALTQKQLNRRLKELKRSRENISPGTAEFKRLNKEIAQTEKRLLKIKYHTQQVGRAWRNVRSNFKKGLGFAAAYFGLQSLLSNIQQAATKNIKLSDSMADVRKTTGLTGKEVRKLNRDLKKLDTRTSQEGLLALATTAGRLGIEGSDNIFQFVQATDQIKISLGEDLGEDAIRQVGKLIDIFKIDEKFNLEDGMLRVGSAINTLGASSTANEGFLVDFAKRFAGIAPGANISLQNTLGLAATMDVLGQSSESSSTALGQLIVHLGKDIPAFAKLAGVSTKEFSNLLENDANQALITVLEGARSTKGGLEGMVATLQKLGVDGARATSVIGVLAKNTDELKKQQKIANLAFAEGTSLTEEFIIKNDNLAGKLEKLKKKFDSFISTDGFRSFIGSSIGWASKFLDYLRIMPGFLEENKTAIALLLATLAARRWAFSIEQINALSQAFQTQLLAIRANTAAMSINAVAANTLKASWRGLKAAFMSNPIGLITTAALALVAAYDLLIKKKKAVIKTQVSFEKKMRKTIAGSEALFRQLIKTNISTTERKKLIEEINNKYGSYLSNLLTEKSSLDDIVEAQQKVNSGLREEIILKMDKDARTALITEEIRLTEALAKSNELLQKTKKIGTVDPRMHSFEKQLAENSIAMNEAQLESIKEKLKALDELKAKRLEKYQISPLSKDPEDDKNDSESDKELKEREALQEFIRLGQQEAALRQLQEDEAELERIRIKYDKQLQAAADHKEEKILLEQLMAQELEDKKAEFKERDDEQQRATLEEFNSNFLSQHELEIQEVTNKYDALFQLASGHEDKIAVLKKTKAKELNKIQQKQDLAELTAKKNIELAKYNSARTGFGLLKDLSKEKSEAYKIFFAAEKAAAIAEIFINLQKEVAKLKVMYPGVSAPFVTQATVSAYTSIAGVAAQVIPQFRKGGLLKGPTHEEGGLDVIHPKTGQKILELEGDEVVLSKATVDNNPEIIRELLQASLFNGGKTQLDVLRPEVVENMQQFRYGGFVDRSTPAPIQELKSAISLETNPEDENITPVNNASNELLVAAIDKLMQRLDEPMHAIYDDKQVNNISKRQALLHKIKR